MGRMIGPPRLVTAATIDTFAWENGDEIVFQPDPAGNWWARWHMIYDSSVGDSMKWLFLGGLPVRKTVTASVTRFSSGTTYANSSTGTIGPSWITPREALWTVEFGAEVNPDADGDAARMGIKFGGLSTSDTFAILNNDARQTTLQSVQESASAIGASSTIIAQYRVGSLATGPSEWLNRWIEVAPVRMA